MPKDEIIVDWDKYALQYDALTMGGANPAYEELVSHVSGVFNSGIIKPDSLIADIGGGTGNFTIPIAKKNPDSHFVILDTSQTMLDIANYKCQQTGLKNVETIYCDAEDIADICFKKNRHFSAAFMVHALYTTGGVNDAKPREILGNIRDCLEKDAYFLISDINRQLDTKDWIPYCLKNMFNTQRKEHGYVSSAMKTAKFFFQNDQGKKANRFIDEKQRRGEYLMIGLDDFVNMHIESGFSRIKEKADHFYRGRDNYLVARP